MKFTFFIIINFMCVASYGQVSKLNQSDLIGCWEFVEYVDTTNLKPITSHKDAPYSLEFKSNNQFEQLNEKGDWVYDSVNHKMTLYKNEFTADEKEMAEYLQLTPREATKAVLSGIKIQNGNLFYLIFSEELASEIYAKMKRKICP